MKPMKFNASFWHLKECISIEMHRNDISKHMNIEKNVKKHRRKTIKHSNGWIIELRIDLRSLAKIEMLMTKMLDRCSTRDKPKVELEDGVITWLNYQPDLLP